MALNLFMRLFMNMCLELYNFFSADRQSHPLKNSFSKKILMHSLVIPSEPAGSTSAWVLACWTTSFVRPSRAFYRGGRSFTGRCP